MEHGRLRLLGGLRPHLDPPVHGAPLRRGRAAGLALAAGRLRRPHLGLRLPPREHRARDAPGHRRLRPEGPRTAPRLPSEAARPALPAQAGEGVKPTRPLPYAPLVDGAGTPSTGRFTLTFSGGEQAGACFTVTSGNRTDGPWTYTTGAGRKISDTWNTAYSKGVYDLSALGPNGFLRTFRGSGTTAGPEVTARHVAGQGLIELTMTNAGGADCRLTVTDAYSGKRASFTVRPGGRVVHRVDLRHSKRWYDLAVGSDQDGTFLRRFAGHVETGEPGVSDPAIITA
ncbi:phospholipase domain-containing protein [Streptomyces stramineus]